MNGLPGTATMKNKIIQTYNDIRYIKTKAIDLLFYCILLPSMLWRLLVFFNNYICLMKTLYNGVLLCVSFQLCIQ